MQLDGRMPDDRILETGLYTAIYGQDFNSMLEFDRPNEARPFYYW